MIADLRQVLAVEREHAGVRRIALPEPREVGLGLRGRVAEAPVHHADLQQDALLAVELLSAAERVVVERDEVVPALARREELDEEAHRLGLSRDEVEHALVAGGGALGRLELPREHSSRAEVEVDPVVAAAGLLGGLEQDLRELGPLLALAEDLLVEAVRARIAGVGLERLLEEAVGVLVAPALLVLPDQAPRAREQRRLQARVARRLGLRDEALGDLLPALLGGLERLERFLDLLVAGPQLAGPLVRRLRRRVVEQLLAVDPRELLAQLGLAIGIARGELGLDLEQPRGRPRLAAILVRATRGAHEPQRIGPGASDIPALDGLAELAERAFVIGILLEQTEQMGDVEHGVLRGREVTPPRDPRRLRGGPAWLVSGRNC